MRVLQAYDHSCALLLSSFTISYNIVCLISLCQHSKDMDLLEQVQRRAT